MVNAECRGQRYLFRRKNTTNVQRKIREMESCPDAWIDAGEGWQGTESLIQLTGWSTPRRCIILRRPTKKKQELKALPENRGAEFAFIKWLRGKILHPITEGDQILLQFGL